MTEKKREAEWLKEQILQGIEDELVKRSPLSPVGQELFDNMSARIEAKYARIPDIIIFGSRVFDTADALPQSEQLMKRDRNVIEIERLSESEAQEYHELWRQFRERIPRLTDTETVTAISIIMGLCPDCWERPRGCQCWNDD